MKFLWKKENESDDIETIQDGCRLSAHETELLLKLANSLSLKELEGKGFNRKDSNTIMSWSIGAGNSEPLS